MSVLKQSAGKPFSTHLLTSTRYEAMHMGTMIPFTSGLVSTYLQYTANEGSKAQQKRMTAEDFTNIVTQSLCERMPLLNETSACKCMLLQDTSIINMKLKESFQF